MSYYKKYIWEVVPENLPKVKRNCPKCNEKTYYINSEKFRVNANKSNLDVWLIYQCENCKSTWNMTIYERINPRDINKDEYKKFLANDKHLAREYAFDLSIYSKNKAEIILEGLNYKIIESELDLYYINENELSVEVLCNYKMDIRVDKFLSDKLEVSRSKIKSMRQNGEFIIKDNKNSLNTKIKNGMEISFVKIKEEVKFLKEIV
ncbi:MAG: DUF1062 domain-containing protein [Clostridium sp.]|uniref:DUF1062 domain-containing protein n=1 Tax=Clostridium sp. TaxID=1506 RepID=UPI002911CB0F|nr:DUF1062 domain-containing protein [Clostridium sp.]MDU5110841.1 DUF1062 domain-containing protein [Clostridium sp.]